MPFGISLWGPAAISAGSSILNGVLGSNASKRAAQLQQQAADRANQYIQGNTNATRDQINTNAADARNLNNFNTTQAQGIINTNTGQANSQYAPYSQVGATAAGGLNTALQNPFSFSLADDPGYQFRLAQGQKALSQSAAAAGGGLSGGALKALTQYGQGFASNEYGNAFARHQQQLQNLFQGAGLGMNAANAVSGNLNQNSALNTSILGGQSQLNANILGGQSQLNSGLTEQTNQLIGNNITGAGNAGASGSVGSANAWGGAANGVAQSANQLFLYNLLKGGGGFGGSKGGFTDSAGLSDTIGA